MREFALINAGFFVKHVELKPDWLKAPDVVEICSVSNCISQPPDGWVEHWLHNELGWFNRIEDAWQVVAADVKPAYRLFAYRLHPARFRQGNAHDFPVPSDVRTDAIPATFVSLGFDSVSKSLDSVLGFECSPLSCNAMAAECRTNQHCLFDSMESAIAGATRFSIEQPEPGDYYVVEVLEQRHAS